MRPESSSHENVIFKGNISGWRWFRLRGGLLQCE